MSAGNGNGYRLPDYMTLNRMQAVENRISSMIADRLGNRGGGDPRRDVYAEAGYPPARSPLDAWFWQDLHERESVAARVNELFALESWQSLPWVYETEDPTESTEFEEAWDALGANLRGGAQFRESEGSPVFGYLRRLDVQCGVGRWGAMLIGIDDDLPLHEPAFDVNKSGPEVKTKPHELLFLRVFPETSAQVTRLETDKRSPRFGLPTEYLLTFGDVDAPLTGGQGSERVHWTRVLHAADNLTSNEWCGTPRCKPVLNNVLGVQKLSCGDPEMYWKAAFPGLAFSTHPQLGGDVMIDESRARDQMERYFNGLERYLLGKGGSWQQLSPSVVDPTAHIEVQLNLICIKMGCPMRIFKGSERGELASSQDERVWYFKRVPARRNDFNTPQLVVGLTDRLQRMGCLPWCKEGLTRNELRRGRTLQRRGRKLLVCNAEGTVVGERVNGYTVEWPEGSMQTEQEKAAVGLQRTQSLAAYLGAQGASALVPPMDFLTRPQFGMGFDEDEATAMLEEGEKLAADEEALAAAEAEAAHEQAAQVPSGVPSVTEMEKVEAGAGQEIEQGAEQAKGLPPSFAQNANPEGINQYTGGGGGKSPAESTTDEIHERAYSDPHLSYQDIAEHVDSLASRSKAELVAVAAKVDVTVPPGMNKLKILQQIKASIEHRKGARERTMTGEELAAWRSTGVDPRR